MTIPIEIETTIRGTQVVVYFDDFVEDLSVGLFFGPEEVWCETTDGDEFEATEEELEPLIEKAIEIARSQEQDYDF